MPSINSAGYSSVSVSPSDVKDSVICELKYDSRVALPPGANSFAAPDAGAPTRDALNDVLRDFAIHRVASLFASTLKRTVFTRRHEESVVAPGVSAPDDEFALAGFVQLIPEKASQCADLVQRLSQLAGVWKAYIAPRPEPAAKKSSVRKKTTRRKRGTRKASRRNGDPLPPAAPNGSAAGSRNFEPAQGYLCDAPNGVGACAVWNRPGAKGKSVTICDIEGAWQLEHEDLPGGIKLIGGTMINDLGWRNHGTAVLGQMVSTPANIGCVGISHEATPVVHSAVIDQAFNAAGAIAAAANTLKAGDVILIELHARGGPDGKYVAMQYWDPIFSAIRSAVRKGIVVVEAAGNGDENFDRPEYAGTGLQKDSGAIIVGAGVPPTNYFDAYAFGSTFPAYSRIGAPRSRIWFSNYGRIVDLQAWGWHVTSLAYGDAQGGSDEKRWYTHRFSGTSSASPIVTGAVACLQGFAKENIGRVLTPSEVRDILKATGTPQVDDSPRAPLTQNIGPQPNLAVAVAEVLNRFRP